MNYYDIFMLNAKTGEVHSANKCTGSCNLKALNCDIFPMKNLQEFEDFKENMLENDYDFCGHCFPSLSKK